MRGQVSPVARSAAACARASDAAQARALSREGQSEGHRRIDRPRARRHPLRQPATRFRHAHVDRSRAAARRCRSGSRERLCVDGTDTFGDRGFRRERDGGRRLRCRTGCASLWARLHPGRRRGLLLCMRSRAAGTRTADDGDVGDARQSVPAERRASGRLRSRRLREAARTGSRSGGERGLKCTADAAVESRTVSARNNESRLQTLRCTALCANLYAFVILPQLRGVVCRIDSI
ncbi:hypothetical protein PCAR4_790025 [Paraburkholderia caribensis]|nr:hypothetical protein PCAR4_790025 [Paraburkholderia caribensis]